MKITKIFTFAFVFAASVLSSSAQFTSTVVSLTGSVLDQYTKKPVALTVEVLDSDGEKFSKAKSNARDGYYFLTGLKPGKKYIVQITDSRYLKYIDEFEVPNTDKYSDYSKDIQVTTSRINSEILVSVSPFELSKASIRPGVDNYLKEYVDILLDNPTVKVAIEVYPDNDTDKNKNKLLTFGRAEALKNYFIQAGIDAGRLDLKNYDTVDPKNPPPSEKRAKGKRYVGSVILKITAL